MKAIGWLWQTIRNPDLFSAAVAQLFRNPIDPLLAL
jgi:hypothetical protein